MSILLSFEDHRFRDAPLADTSRERWVIFASVVNSVPLIYCDCKQAHFWLFPYFIDEGIEWLVSTISNRPSVIGLHICQSCNDWLASSYWLRSARLCGLLSCLLSCSLVTSWSVDHGGSSCLRWGTFSITFSFSFFISLSLCFSCCSSCSLRSRYWGQICILVTNVEDVAILKIEGLNSGWVTLINRLPHSFVFKKFQLAGIDLKSLTQFSFQIVQSRAKIDLDSGAPCFREHS